MIQPCVHIMEDEYRHYILSMNGHVSSKEKNHIARAVIAAQRTNIAMLERAVCREAGHIQS